ncbi:hypothetical protein ACSLBF_21285 (plasmid) [Pseudoalteromonas sp. T1lg65]|uniref:hypothetical protein n=1 Tax=Pseudoalteromonas sp. T1lg65 TaxID=2077101 RepID=UPI003F7B1BC3
MDNKPELDNTILAKLHSRDDSALLKEIDDISCTNSDIVMLLAQYQTLSEQDDELFDAWYDSLCEAQLRVLKAFEILRSHLEQRI